MIGIELFWPLAVGWASGMMVNYLADNLPIRIPMGKLVCQACGHPQRLFDYFLWPRKCPHCHQKRKLRVWFIEIILAIGGAWLWLSPHGKMGFWLSLLLAIFLMLVITIDVEHHLILHRVSWFGLGLGVSIGILLHGILATLIGGLVAYGLMWLVYRGGILFVKLLNQLRKTELVEREGLGYGDVNLMGIAGLILGWPGIIAGFVLAILMAGAINFLYLVIRIASRKFQVGEALPYGPFIALAVLILVFFEESFLNFIY